MFCVMPLFGLIITSLAFSTNNDCPAKCVCSKKIIKCIAKGLVEIPIIPSGVVTVDLRYNNISDIPPNTFNDAHDLTSVILNDNQIQRIKAGAFTGLDKLKYLYLFQNKIQHIDSGAFDNLKNLEHLHLQSNNIRFVTYETFPRMLKLDRLYLHNNSLKTFMQLSFKDFPNLKKLRLDMNPLRCDCNLQWLLKLRKQLTQFSLICESPPSLHGLKFDYLKEEDLQCAGPVIRSEPKDIVVTQGGDAMFTCIASGVPQPEIVWLRDSSVIPLDTHRYEVMNNGTLMVHGADESDDEYFECMARNSMGVVRSKRAKIIMHKQPSAIPNFVTKPQSRMVKIGNNFVVFDCLVEGRPIPHITWLHNEERILLDDRITMHHNGTIIIDDIIESDSGLYTCRAENINGVVTSSANLEILIPPVFTSVPRDQNIKAGHGVEFYCNAMGHPMPIISWSKNSVNFTSVVSRHILFTDNSRSLTIPQATVEDSGIYECKAENLEGFITARANLIVNFQEPSRPRIITKPSDSEAYVGTTVQLPCEVESDAEIEWSKDGSRIENTGDRLAITIIGTLIIRNLVLTDAGRYECSVHNEFGRDTVSAFLTVTDARRKTDVFVDIAVTQATKDIDQAIERTMKDLYEKKHSGEISRLFTVLSYPNSRGREVARAAEIYDRTLSKIKKYLKLGLNVSMTEGFSYLNVLTSDHLEIIARLSGCAAHRVENNCSDMCYHTNYRSIDGSCNNFAHSMWGASLTAFRRILLPVYENGFSQPVGWDKTISYNGFRLPSARKISTEIITTQEITEDLVLSHMVMQWGQWLDHDLDHGLPSVSSQTWDGVDCKKTCDYAPPCFPMDVPPNDPRISNRRCIDFVRTSSVCGSGVTSVLFGKFQHREQINQLTSFIDASQVYGFEQNIANDLRDLTNENGTLRVGPAFPGQKSLLPFTGINGMDCRRNVEENSLGCFVAGDIRANEQIGLAAMHTIWMREHNRIASHLKSINPFWDGDKVYNEARKIVGAEIQFITYETWLPLVLGIEGMNMLGPYKGYNRNVNPSISNVFATAALRFGHSMINPILHRYDENFETIPSGHLLLRNAFFAPWRLVEEGGVDPLLRGMFTTPAKLKTPTQNLNSELTEKLFETAHAVALDLAAINIQRGRDHAIPSYTKWRDFCNMSQVNNFHDLRYEISSEEIRKKLEELYGSVHNIDVWVGGILEDQVDGGKVGPLFRCLLVEQFKRLRDGDRFWYENPTTFKPDQLQQIKLTSLARILCDNGDNIDTISENIFVIPEQQEGMVSCDDISSMDFRFWADCKSCGDDRNEIDFITQQRTRRNVEPPLTERDENRLNELENYHKNLEKSVRELKQRVEQLESTCENV